MSYEHKAFVFDVDSFSRELKPLLEEGLRSDKIDQLRDFIVSNKQSLVDPYEGFALENNWEEMLESKDVHQYGDFALTKYYSPTEDKGLGSWWGTVQKLCFNEGELSFSPFLGVPLGVGGQFFDPGKMGSYFQTKHEVSESLNKVLQVMGKIPDDAFEAVREFKEMLEQAIAEKKGLYITF